MYLLSEAAYIDNPQQCINNGLTNDSFIVTDIVTFKCGTFSADCTAIVAVSSSEKAIAIAFRGTTGPDQLTEETYKVLFRDKRPYPFGSGKVQSYFGMSLLGLLPCLRESIDRQRNIHPDFDLWVTGHSLGGSLASIAANYLSHAIYNESGSGSRIKLITFGAPRSGDFAFAAEHDRRVPYSFRVVNENDFGPQVPWCKQSVVSVTDTRCEPENGHSFHHAVEVWYPDGMSNAGSVYRTCRGQECNEDITCSSKALRFKYNPLHHLLYFGNYHPTFKRQQCAGGVYAEYAGLVSKPSKKAPELSYEDKCQTFHYW